MKFRRHNALLEIIEKESIETQEELSERLKSLGFNVTQATISRDIKDLRLVKVAGPDGTSRYATSAMENDSEFNMRLRVIFKESVINVNYAANIVVIKTITGVANAACTGIDAMRFPDVVGSIAGDDTIFIVLKDEKKAAEFCENVQKMLK